MTYKPATTKEGSKFYPVVKFYSQVVSDSYVINEPKETRPQALQVARQTINRLKEADSKNTN